VPAAAVVDRITEMARNDADRMTGWMYFAFGPATNDPRDLKRIIPYIFNVHGKFYEITPDGEEETVPYDPVLKALRDGGYAGYIDSEYEGQRLTQDAYVTDSCEQVRRHHVLMTRCLADA